MDVGDGTARRIQAAALTGSAPGVAQQTAHSRPPPSARVSADKLSPRKQERCKHTITHADGRENWRSALEHKQVLRLRGRRVHEAARVQPVHRRGWGPKSSRPRTRACAASGLPTATVGRGGRALRPRPHWRLRWRRPPAADHPAARRCCCTRRRRWRAAARWRRRRQAQAGRAGPGPLIAWRGAGHR